MTSNSLPSALQGGTNSLLKALFGGQKPQRSGSAEDPLEGPKKDRFDRTPASAQGGFRTFSFQFRHLAIRRETAAVRSIAQQSPQGQEDQPVSTASRSVQEERLTALNLFYSRTQKISVDMGQDAADHLQSTSQNVGRTFEVSISLEASFLHQFASQSESFAQGDQTLFDKYLSATDQMTGISGEAAQGFFDMVDQALEDAQSAVMSGLDDFLNSVGATLGLEGDALTNFKSQVADQVAGFFSDLDQFVSQSRDLMTTARPLPETPRAAAAEPPPQHPVPLA